MNQSLRSAGVALVIATLVGCVVSPSTSDLHGKPLSADAVDPQGAWGAAKEVVLAERIYFSAQPDANALEVARANGVTTVINLRASDEMDWDEAAAARSLGMTYLSLPIVVPNDLEDRAVMKRISQRVNDLGDEKLLVHCSSGNRAAAWWAVHLVDEHSMRPPDAIALARKVGLTSPELEERVEALLTEQ